jgi:hypothetical protein
VLPLLARRGRLARFIGPLFGRPLFKRTGLTAWTGLTVSAGLAFARPLVRILRHQRSWLILWEFLADFACRF